ncbi:MAG TPA: SCP2 sterol-binding domain-containing protein [Mycobacteriales bacterium]|nr:SCP2 sterol-binding domain-containing protein [Mycobacteriales bacterium]
MATVEECEAAMHRLAERMRSPDAADARSKVLDRSVTCHLRDLDVTFAGQLRDGEIQDIRQVDTPNGQIKLAMTSDDLLALVDGSLSFARAWASGRLKVDASFMDLIKLRTLL